MDFSRFNSHDTICRIYACGLQGFQCLGLLAADILHWPSECLRRFAVAIEACNEVLLADHYPGDAIHGPFPPLPWPVW